MASIRIFSLSSALLILSSFSLSTSNSSNTLSTWQTTYLNKMSPQQLQFTANFLYLSCAIATVESKIRQFFIPIARLNQTIRKNISTYKNTTDDLAMLKTLVERLTYVTGARTIYIETLNTCAKYHEESKSHIVDVMNARLIDTALESIQNDAQTQLRAWSDAKNNETNEQLKKSATNMATSAHYFEQASNFYKELGEGTLSIPIPQEHESYKSLFVLNTILNSNPELLAIAEDATNTLNETSQYAEQIIVAGTEIYKQYYATVYNMIMLPTFDKRYATTMFGMHDVLPNEYKTCLPHPDKVFEHALQTTKLYTQTELLQQQ